MRMLNFSLFGSSFLELQALSVVNRCALNWMLILTIIERNICQCHISMWMTRELMINHVGIVSDQVDMMFH